MRIEQTIATVARFVTAEVREICGYEVFAALRLHLWQMRMSLGLSNTGSASGLDVDGGKQPVGMKRGSKPCQSTRLATLYCPACLEPAIAG